MLDFPLFVHRVSEVLSDGRARQVADALFAGKWCDQSIIAAGDVLGRVNALQKRREKDPACGQFLGTLYDQSIVVCATVHLPFGTVYR